MKINISKKVYIDIVEYLFVIILVLNCNTIWTSYEDTQLNIILKIALVIVAALYAAVNNKFSYGDLNAIILAVASCTIYFLVYTLVVNYNVVSFLGFVIDVFCIYVFVRLAMEKGQEISLLLKYENVILVIAVISLLFWFFGSILGIFHPTGVVYYTWTGDTSKALSTYYNLYFETQTVNGVIRNTAIFTEAPMYNFHLCIALLAELFCKQRASKRNCAILILAVLTTLSTTGWCLLVIVLFMKYVFSQNFKEVGYLIRAAAVPIALIVGIVIVQTLVLDKLGTNSGNIRIDDFIAGFKAWKTHPLFGAGYGNSDYVKKFMSSFRSYNQGFSNSPMYILYQGGIFLALPYIYFIGKWIWTCIHRRDIQWFLFFACFIYLFIITITPYNFLTIFLFMSYGFDRRKETAFVPKQEQRSYEELQIKSELRLR